MDVFRKKWRKAVEKCKSMNQRSSRETPCGGDHRRLWKSKSWPSERKTTTTTTPQGCFAVYVGPERQRFVVGAQQAGHPLFKDLLDDAESEYGYNCRGPLVLPCDVDLFCRVLTQISRTDLDPDPDEIRPPGGCAAMALRSPRGKGYCPSPPPTPCSTSSHYIIFELNY